MLERMQGNGQPASTDGGSTNYFSISGNQYGVSSILANKFKSTLNIVFVQDAISAYIPIGF